MKANIFKLSLVSLFLTVLSCETSNESSTEQQQPKPNGVFTNTESQLALTRSGKSADADCSFEYEGPLGPEFWADSCGDSWKDCNGQSQSPIDIVTNSVIETGDINNINTNYTTSTTKLFNNGHTLQFNYDEGSYAQMNNIDYNLLQFHFHTGSEHTINGKRYPMEMHLVHQDPNTQLLAVIGILFEEGEENEVLENYLDKLPENEDDYYVSNEEFHITDLIPDNLEFYTYSGSLTTPGCSEIVTWYVVKKTVTASKKQLETFERIMHTNYRPAQNLNGRTVLTKS